jgi:hypothetical protein
VKNVSIRRGCNRENTSVLMAVSASGVMLPPLFIFKGKRLPSNLLHGAPAGSKVTVSENAFIDTELFDQWIDHFIANIPSARPVLLTLDNHSAHIALSVRRKCIANGIHILSFPPHSTHILQPLDAGCFRSFKAQWRKVVNDWALQTLGQNIERKGRARLIGTALSMAMIPVVVQKSWESTGIWPFDHSAVRQGMITRDTVDTSRFANYEITHDPLPIGKLAGRSVRSLQRNGIDLSELRSYKLTVRDSSQPMTLDQKRDHARRMLIEVGPQRLLTHEACMREEIGNEERKKEASEVAQMRSEDSMGKKRRTQDKAEEKKALLAVRRRRRTEVQAQKLQAKLARQLERESKSKLKSQKRSNREPMQTPSERTKAAHSHPNPPVLSCVDAVTM